MGEGRLKFGNCPLVISTISKDVLFEQPLALRFPGWQAEANQRNCWVFPDIIALQKYPSLLVWFGPYSKAEGQVLRFRERQGGAEEHTPAPEGRRPSSHCAMVFNKTFLKWPTTWVESGSQVKTEEADTIWRQRSNPFMACKSPTKWLTLVESWLLAKVA